VDKEHGEGSSVDTLLRRLRVWQNLNKAPRSDRAEYMVLLEHLAERGRAGAAAWLPIAEGALTYVRARGAAFPLDEHLLSEAMFLADVLHADEGADAGKARVMAARLVAAARTP
jgi:hypothetical protein